MWPHNKHNMYVGMIVGSHQQSFSWVIVDEATTDHRASNNNNKISAGLISNYSNRHGKIPDLLLPSEGWHENPLDAS